MKEFQYVAIDAQKKIVKGSMQADSLGLLRSKLKILDLTMLHCRESKPILSINFAKFFRRVSARDKENFFLQLYYSEKVSVPLSELLMEFKSVVRSKYFRRVIDEISSSLQEGNKLSVVLYNYKNLFGELSLNIVAVGEQSGNMMDSIKRLLIYNKWEKLTRRKFRQALMMPCITILLMLVMMVGMDKVVLPKMLDLVEEIGLDIPIYTKIFQFVAGDILGYSHYFIIILIVFFIVLKTFFAKVKFIHRIYHMFILKIPGLGSVVKNINLSKFFSILLIAYKNEISVVEAVKIANNTVTNLVIKESIDIISVNLFNGQTIAKSFELSKQFSNLVLAAIKIGENNGDLLTSFSTISDMLEENVDSTIELLVNMIKPLALLVAGLVIIFTVLAVFGPLYQNFAKFL